MSSPAGPSESPDVISWAGLDIPRRRLVMAVVIIAALVGIGLRVVELLRPGHLLGVDQYDDAVYLGASLRLLAGALPYRDFILIQPPGLPLLLAPVAALSHWVGARGALAAARVLVPLVAGIDVLLLGWLLRHRSPLVVGVACFALAAYPDDLLSAQTVYQEPFLNLFCLLGAALLFRADTITFSRRQLWWAGVVFGLAGAVKLWAIFPLLILALLLWRSPRRILVLVAGSAVAFLVVCSPFLIVSAGPFIHQVIVSQAERVDVTRVPLEVRLVMMTGVVITNVTAVTPLQRWLGLGVAAALAVFLATAFIFFPRPPGTGVSDATGRRRTRRTTELERYALGALVLTALALMIPDDFYFHYATFLGPFLVLALGLAAGRVEPVLPEIAFGAAALVLLVALLHAVLVARGVGLASNPGAALDRLIPAGACVITDDPAYLINSDRYQGGPRCPPVVDPYGTTIARSGGLVADGGAAQNREAVDTWLGYFRSAQYLLLTPASSVRIPWARTLTSYVYSHFNLVATQPVLVLRRGPEKGSSPGYSLPSLAGA
ncbi:MAG: glycosyltransferase 87 family protein [Candidatus Dormiibacterota bacterium]